MTPLDVSRSPALLCAVIESAPTAMVMIDDSGRIVLVNAETEQLFGYRRDELIGELVEVLVPLRFRGLHPEYRTGFFLELKARRMGAGRDLFGLRKDGSEFPIEIGLNPIRTDEGQFVLSAIVDISRRKTLEARFGSAVESAPMAMVMIDRTGFIVLVNAETEKLFGYTRDELLGRPIEILVPERSRPGHPELRERFFNSPVARRMGAGRDLFGVRKNGSEFPVEIGLNPIETEEGWFVLSAVVDITERKRLEAAQLFLNEELEQRVAERTRELADSNSALEAFGYSVSHDLRTPLRNMQSLAQALEEDYAERLDAGGRDFCRRITAAARKMDTLINDLLAYSRLSRTDLPLGRVDLNSVLAEVRAALARSRDLEAQVTVEGQLPPVVGHRATLVQVVTNLLTNAVKFVAPRVAPRVQIRAEDRGEHVRVWVEDNGIGIAPEYYGRIFNVFERLHGEESYPGTGIGLAIVKKGLERMRGRVGLESEVGRGSRFWLELPQVREAT